MGNWWSDQKNFPITKREKKKYGWIRDIPDKRDIKGQFPPWSSLPPKTQVDLRNTGNLPEIYDQGKCGSCTANAIAAVFDYELKKRKAKNYIEPSRHFIYFNQRIIESNVDLDTGASIRDGLKVLMHIGTCAEKDCPYDPQRFFIYPTSSAYLNAQQYNGIKYRKVSQDDSIFAALILGYPIICGLSIYESFEDPNGVIKTGVMTLPRDDENLLGGHVMVICGYSKVGSEIRFLLRNSMGKKWGEDGYCWVSSKYIMDPYLCNDLWTMEKVFTNEEDIHKIQSFKDIVTKDEPVIVESQSKPSLEEISKEILDTKISEEPKEAEVSEEPKKEEVKEEPKETEVSEEPKEAEVSEKPKEDTNNTEVKYTPIYKFRDDISDKDE